MAQDLNHLIAQLELQPHPEGGWYRETQRSDYSTTIYYLLANRQVSHFHKVTGADEVWHHYEGNPLALHILDESGHRRIILGMGQWHAVVPAGAWQAAESLGDEHSLVGCTVAPAFDFGRFSLADRAALTAEHPEQAGLIRRFTR